MVYGVGGNLSDDFGLFLVDDVLLALINPVTRDDRKASVLPFAPGLVIPSDDFLRKLLGIIPSIMDSMMTPSGVSVMFSVAEITLTPLSLSFFL